MHTNAAVSSTESISRGHPRLLFATLMFGMLAQALTFTAFASALPQLAHDFGPNGEFVAQMVMSMAAFGLMFGSVISGWILEKLGTRTTLLIALLVFSVCGAGGLVFKTAALLLASRAGVGLATACISTTCIWGISTEYRGNRVATALGIATALGNLCSVAGTLLGGYLSQVGGWQLAFAQYPVLGAAGLLLVAVSLRQVRPQPAAAGSAGLAALKSLLPWYLLTMLLYAVMFVSSSQFAFLLVDDGVTEPGQRALILSAAVAVAGLTSFSYGILQRLLTTSGTFVLALGGMALAVGVAAWSHSPAMATVASALMGVYVGIVSPYIYQSVTECADTGSRSRAIGLLGAFLFGGAMLNPILYAPLGRAVGMRNAFYLTACVLVALAIGTLTKAAGARRQIA
jgi:MFS family permease